MRNCRGSKVLQANMKHLTKAQETALFGPEDHEAPIVKVRHTPSPWTAWDDDGTGTPPCVLAKQVTSFGNFYVAQCNVFDDARLIAAAPELLEELKNARRTLHSVSSRGDLSPERVSLLTTIDAAIAKAEGRE